ncbi:MAG: hypothetical protein WBK91_05400 [Alphaproteobacteria bacterium]
MDNWFDMIVGIMVGGYFVALGLGFKVRPEALRGKKIFVALGLAIMIGGIALLALRSNLQSIPLGMTPKEIVAKVKAEMQIPMVIDHMTRLDALEAGDGRVIFFYTVTASSMEQFKSLIEKAQDFLKKDGCHTVSNKQMLMAGIALEYRYTLHNGPMAEPIELTPKECGY